MAVVTRKSAKGQKIYWVAFYDADRKQRWERVGTDKRAAEALDRRRQKEVADGTYELAARPTMPFGQWLLSWAEKRTNRNAKDDLNVLRNHVLTIDWLRLLPVEDLRPKHSAQLVDELRAKVSEQTGKPLSEKYVANLYGLYRTAVQDARRAELLAIDPCVLKRGALRRKSKRGVRIPYEPADVITLLNVEDPEAAALATLALLTGCREGEVCGVRWRCWDKHSVPLGCIDVVSQYHDRPLKTETDGGRGEHARKVPVLPELERFLTWWWETGFEFVYCRKPTMNDFIVPRTPDGKNHTKSSAYKLWRKACESVGVENRSLHSTRHTFISFAKRGGAREVIERVTHNASGAMVDHYTTYDWEPLCSAVLCLKEYLDRFLDRSDESQGKRLPEGWRRRESKSGPVVVEAGKSRRNSEKHPPENRPFLPELPRSAARDCPSQETPTPSDTDREVPSAFTQDAEIRRASGRLRRAGDRPAALLRLGVDRAMAGDEAGTLEVLGEVAALAAGGAP